MATKWKFWESTSPTEHKVLNQTTVQSFNRTTDWINAKYDYSKPFINEYAGSKWIPFGEDNLYPYVILDMYHTSSFHNSLIDFKLKSVAGNGLMCNVKGSGLEVEILREKIKDKFNGSFLRRFILEYQIHGRVYIQVKKSGEKYVDPKIVPAERVRIDKEEDGYWVNPDWRRKRSDTEWVAKYDKYDTENPVQMICYQELLPGFDFYAVPSYISAANWIYLDGNISLFQKNNLENSINPSAIMKFYRDIANKEEKAEFISDLQDAFTGSKNAGKILAFFSNGKENAPDIEIASPNQLDTAFAGAQENIIRNVSYAHLVNPLLMGITTTGSLGNSNEVQMAYAIYSEIFLNGTQDQIDEYLNDLMKKLGYGATVYLDRKEEYIPRIDDGAAEFEIKRKEK